MTKLEKQLKLEKELKNMKINFEKKLQEYIDLSNSEEELLNNYNGNFENGF